MKQLIRLLLLTILSVRVMDSADQPEPVPPVTTKKGTRYFKDGIKEPVVFYARQSVNSDKKIARRGEVYINPEAEANVLICHGFMCDRMDISFLHLMFKDYNSMTFDFRAHGEDIEEQSCTFGRDEAYDVIAAVEFIKSHPKLKGKPLIVYGFSMGAVASIIAQAQDKSLFNAMILDCPFESSDKLLERVLSQLKINVFGYEVLVPCSFLKNYIYRPYVQSFLKEMLKTLSKVDSTQVNTAIAPVYPEEAIKYVSVPCFFIGCVNDDKATEGAVTTVYNGAQGFKRLWITDGRRHYDSVFFRIDDYFYKVNKFIKNYMTDSFKKKKQEKIIKDTFEYKIKQATTQVSVA
jgi:pimeloyl-ACP methyl ester carboxylesterase